MKRRMMFFSVALALVFAIMGSTVVLAAKPASFSANGEIAGIEIPTELWQAGKSDRWVVGERELSGWLSGGINDDFTITYRGNFNVWTQAGTLHGTVTFPTEPYVMRVNGRVKPLEMVPTPLGIDLPKLTIEGRWILTEGAKGQGDLDAWAIFIPTTEEDPEGPGHVKQILFSSVELTGKWQQ